MPYMVVVAHPGRERDCRAEIRDAGFAAYQPLYKERIAKRGKRVWHERLLLGRYLFARWPDDLSAPRERVDWRAIASLRLVTDLFMHPDEERPILVRDGVVEALRAREDRHGFVVLGSAAERFAIGQQVRAAAGVMAGAVGTYAGHARKGYDAALIEMFGATARVEFAPGFLVAA